MPVFAATRAHSYISAMGKDRDSIEGGPTWAVICGDGEAVIYRREKRHSLPERVDALTEPEAGAHGQELTSDLPGRTHDRMGPGRHTLNADFDPAEKARLEFVKRVAARIEHGRVKGEFTRLILAAPPATLGELRDELSAPTAATLVQELDKNLIHRSPESLAEDLGW